MLGAKFLGKFKKPGRFVRKPDCPANSTVERRGQNNSFPNPETPVPRHAPGVVNGRNFSGHAFDRMQERGFTPTIVENAIRTGSRSSGHMPGISKYTDLVNGLKLIVDDATGNVVTIF